MLHSRWLRSWPLGAVLMSLGCPGVDVVPALDDERMETTVEHPDSTVQTVTGSGNLGWPFDTRVPAGCPSQSVDDGGYAWDGWANFQWPPTVTARVDQWSDLMFGQVWAPNATQPRGQANGWQAELMVGPWGTLPTDDARCWQSFPATFNVDVGNNDEYMLNVKPTAPGLYSLIFRYRPPGGTWRYGDRNGSHNGLQPDHAGLMIVPDERMDHPLVVATLNLRCRIDNWNERLPLVVQALSRVSPDLIAFQEDCREDGLTQAHEVRKRLSALVNRGYEVFWVGTHAATYNGQRYDEGVSVLSAHPVTHSHVLDLPYAWANRKALAVDVEIRGHLLRFYSAHLESGSENQATRMQEIQKLLQDMPTHHPGLLAGDFNAQPHEDPVKLLAQHMTDVWARANPSHAGLTFPAGSPGWRIDYVFAPPSLSPGIKGARLLEDQMNGTWLSDHRGVAVAITWP